MFLIYSVAPVQTEYNSVLSNNFFDMDIIKVSICKVQNLQTFSYSSCCTRGSENKGSHTFATR